MIELDINLLKSLLAYCPKTGLLTWNKSGAQAGTTTSLKNSRTQYIQVSVKGRLLRAHRIAWAIHYGEWPKYVDHIDRNGLNNKIDNLRSVSLLENQRNRSKQINNTSGTTGVVQDKRSGKWMARINIKGKKINLGTFTHKSDAVDARRNAEVDYGFLKAAGGD